MLLHNGRAIKNTGDGDMWNPHPTLCVRTKIDQVFVTRTKIIWLVH